MVSSFVKFEKLCSAFSFFAVDFAGYILSPMHKCVAIGKMYFGTSLTYYGKLLGGWALLLIALSGVMLYA